MACPHLPRVIVTMGRWETFALLTPLHINSFDRDFVWQVQCRIIQQEPKHRINKWLFMLLPYSPTNRVRYPRSAYNWTEGLRTDVIWIWIIVKRLSQKAIQRHSQRDRQVKRKVFKLHRGADDIPCSIKLRSAGGVSFQSAGPTTAKARFWDRELRDQGTRRSQRSAERSEWEERADSGLDMSSHRYLGARPCSDSATRSRTLYLTRTRIYVH